MAAWNNSLIDQHRWHKYGDPPAPISPRARAALLKEAEEIFLSDFAASDDEVHDERLEQRQRQLYNRRALRLRKLLRSKRTKGLKIKRLKSKMRTMKLTGMRKRPMPKAQRNMYEWVKKQRESGPGFTLFPVVPASSDYGFAFYPTLDPDTPLGRDLEVDPRNEVS